MISCIFPLLYINHHFGSFRDDVLFFPGTLCKSKKQFIGAMDLVTFEQLIEETCRRTLPRNHLQRDPNVTTSGHHLLYRNAPGFWVVQRFQAYSSFLFFFVFRWRNQTQISMLVNIDGHRMLEDARIFVWSVKHFQILKRLAIPTLQFLAWLSVHCFFVVVRISHMFVALWQFLDCVLYTLTATRAQCTVNSTQWRYLDGW